MSQLSPGVFAGIALLFFLLLALAVALPLYYKFPRKAVLLAALPIALAFLLRWRCLDHVTYDYLDFLSQWAALFRECGGFAAVKLPIGNYNAPYLYFLAAISYLPIPDLYLIKLFSILFDVVLAWGGLRLARHYCPKGSVRPLIAYCLLLLLPTVVLNGSFWAQCDSLYGALVLHAFASVLAGRAKNSFALLAVAFSFKLQTVFLLPLWLVFWFCKRVKFRDFFVFPAVYLLTILPALFLGKPISDILGVYFGQAVEYADYLTLNAPSIYALIPYGKQVDTAFAARLGILAAFVLVLSVLTVLFLFRTRINKHIILTASILFAVGIPLLLPHMHDRYFFLADILTLILACIWTRRVWIAACVQIASLGAYHAYLVLQYAFPMKWGTYLLLFALVGSAVILGFQLHKATPNTIE